MKEAARRPPARPVVPDRECARGEVATQRIARKQRAQQRGRQVGVDLREPAGRPDLVVLTRIAVANKSRFKGGEGVTSYKISPMKAAAGETLLKQLLNASILNCNTLPSQRKEAFEGTTFSPRLRKDGRDSYAIGATAYNVLHGEALGEGSGLKPNKFYDDLRPDLTKPAIAEAPTTAVGAAEPVSQGSLDKAALLADLVN